MPESLEEKALPCTIFWIFGKILRCFDEQKTRYHYYCLMKCGSNSQMFLDLGGKTHLQVAGSRAVHRHIIGIYSTLMSGLCFEKLSSWLLCREG